ncbi:MAG: hypothetical protein U0793_17515 [Gemmataceae bacterium]
MDPYTVYCLLGLAEAEDRKVFLWPQWEKCFYLFDDAFAAFAKSSVIRSRQAFEVPLPPRKGQPPGTRNITLKQVPFGKMRWTHDDNKKWSQRPLLESEFPVVVQNTEILSSDRKPNPPEIQIWLTNEGGAPGAKYNQALTLSVCQPVASSKPAAYWEGLITALTPIVRAVRIGRTVRPWWLERPKAPGVVEGSSLAGARFAKRYDQLDLADDWQTWEYLL